MVLCYSVSMSLIIAWLPYKPARKMTWPSTTIFEPNGDKIIKQKWGSAAPFVASCMNVQRLMYGVIFLQHLKMTLNVGHSNAHAEAIVHTYTSKRPTKVASIQQ